MSLWLLFAFAVSLAKGEDACTTLADSDTSARGGALLQTRRGLHLESVTLIDDEVIEKKPASKLLQGAFFGYSEYQGSPSCVPEKMRGLQDLQLQRRLRSLPQIAGPMDALYVAQGEEKDIGSTAPLDATGFNETTALCCPMQMEIFFTRLLQSKGYSSCSKPHVQGLMHWFACVPDMDFEYVLTIIKNGNPCKYWAPIGQACPQLSKECSGHVCSASPTEEPSDTTAAPQAVYGLTCETESTKAVAAGATVMQVKSTACFKLGLEVEIGGGAEVNTIDAFGSMVFANPLENAYPIGTVICQGLCQVPTTEVPTTDAGKTEASTTKVPYHTVPTTETPTTEAPSTEAAITTETPTTEAPTTETATSEAATTEAATTEAATTEAATTAAAMRSGNHDQRVEQAAITEAPTREALAGESKYLGCFRDNESRDMKHGPKAYGFSVASCAARCCSTYNYFALQHEGFCFCDSTYSTPEAEYPKLADPSCGSQGLGGLWTNSVYMCQKADATCVNTDNGAVDSYEDRCAEYEGNVAWCGEFDDADFKASEMCCTCGGGQKAAITTKTPTTEAPTTETATPEAATTEAATTEAATTEAPTTEAATVQESFFSYIIR